MKKTLGYTLTDCYSGNADFRGQQKQFVVKIDETTPNKGRNMEKLKGIINVFTPGYVNGPADSGRYSEFFPIAEISEKYYEALLAIGNEFMALHPKPEYPAKEMKDSIIRLVNKFIPVEDRATCERYIYWW